MNKNIILRKAVANEAPIIWEILAAAIERRKADGSDQWQDGYPNEGVVADDLNRQYGYVLVEGKSIIGYCALILNDEPTYKTIKGQWLSNEDFMVIHRIAIAPDHLGKGLVQTMFTYIEELAKEQHIHSLRADTNFDNAAMLHLLQKMGYHYCGEVMMRGRKRKAFEKYSG